MQLRIATFVNAAHHANMPLSNETNPTKTPHKDHPIGLILGIDPGLRRTGYAILSPGVYPDPGKLIEAGIIRLNERLPLTERLVELKKSLTDLITGRQLTLLACEELYAHYKHPRTAILMGHARGVILAEAAQAGLSILSIAATNVKKLLTGNGHASKRQIQIAVTTTLRLKEIPEPNDVADAIAIALAGARLREAANANLEVHA